MSEQTQAEPAPVANGSTIFGVSVRGWLAIMLTGTICLSYLSQQVMASLGWTSVNVVIPEPLYSGFIAALGFYLGQTKK